MADRNRVSAVTIARRPRLSTTESDDVSSDDYPVLAALDRGTQLEVRE